MAGEAQASEAARLRCLSDTPRGTQRRWASQPSYDLVGATSSAPEPRLTARSMLSAGTEFFFFWMASYSVRFCGDVLPCDHNLNVLDEGARSLPRLASMAAFLCRGRRRSPTSLLPVGWIDTRAYSYRVEAALPMCGTHVDKHASSQDRGTSRGRLPGGTSPIGWAGCRRAAWRVQRESSRTLRKGRGRWQWALPVGYPSWSLGGRGCYPA